MSCRWDREAGNYLADGEPCRVDEYGDPTNHCTAQRTCAEHIGPNELTCARCSGRVRSTIRRIPLLSALMMPVALTAGVNSEAANLAGPAADTEAWSWRKVAARQGGSWHLSLVEEDDELHPYSVLTRWALMIAEDYGHELGTLDVTTAADYLDRNLGRIAQDDTQDFPLLAREMRRCRRHLESVLATMRHIERGAPCPECSSPETGLGPRLVREYGHWCERADCERIHYDDDSGDQWVCPRNRRHAWTLEAYDRWIEERKGMTA